MNKKPTKKAEKRPPSGGKKAHCYTHKELCNAGDVEEAMYMALEGRFDEETKQAALAIAALIEYKKHQDKTTPDRKPSADLENIPKRIHAAKTQKEAQPLAAKAMEYLCDWLTSDPIAKRERALPEKLKQLNNLLTTRPLRPDAMYGGATYPRPADEGAFAILSLWVPLEEEIEGRSIPEVLADISKQDRDIWYTFTGAKTDDRLARKLFTRFHKIKGKPGRPQKSG